MSKFITYNETLTSVLTSSGTFDHRELSGRPEFTPDNTYTTLTCGFSASKTFSGYNFDTLQGIMLSTVDGAQIFQSGSYDSTVTIIDATTGTTSLSYLCGGATISPALSGYFLTPSTSSLLAGTYTINNYNSMSVQFPVITATGNIDVIPINAAGFATLSADINTTITIT